MGGGIDDLSHALMIEENRNAAGCEKHARTIAKGRHNWVIDLEALSGIKLNREGPERLTRHQRFKGFLEMLCGHELSFRAPDRPGVPIQLVGRQNNYIPVQT